MPLYHCQRQREIEKEIYHCSFARRTEDVRLNFLHDDVGWNLENDVGYEENAERNVVLISD